jgi:hypothetical protein
MAKPSKIKIDVTKLLKQHFYVGKKGTYVTLILWENRDGPDEYGNTHSVKQEIPKEARDAGEQEPYVGNGIIVTGDDPPTRNRQSDRGFSRPSEGKTRDYPLKDRQDRVPSRGETEDSIPF